MIIKVPNEFSYEVFDVEGNCRDDAVTYCSQTLVVIC